MNSDHLFVYGTLMRGFDNPMAKLLQQGADFIGAARCRGRLYRVKHYPGLVLSDDADDVVFGEVYRLRQPDELLREFDMYEACGEGFAEPTEYIRRMLPVTLEDGAVERGLDLHLQLARRPPAAHRLGAVSGEVGAVPDATTPQSRALFRLGLLLHVGTQHGVDAALIAIACVLEKSRARLHRRGLRSPFSWQVSPDQHLTSRYRIGAHRDRWRSTLAMSSSVIAIEASPISLALTAIAPLSRTICSLFILCLRGAPR